VFSKCVTSKILKMLSEDNDDYKTFKEIINDNQFIEMGDIDE